MSKLEERIKKYDIPPIEYLPKGKAVLVYRLPPEKETAGGIVLPQVWTERHEDGYGNVTESAVKKEPVCKGVLLAAGLVARDEMRDHLIEIGDIVYFGRYAGSDRDAQRDPENAGRTISEMKIEDINGSADGLERLRSAYTIEYDEETGQHYYEKKTTKRKAA